MNTVMMAGRNLLILLIGVTLTRADNNFLTGANDVIVVQDENGNMKSSPFSVQFGKKDIWLPRSGHIVSIQVNGKAVPVSMTLDSSGRGYFSVKENGGGAKKQYRFWSALLGVRDPAPKHRTTVATQDQLSQLVLVPGVNSIQYRVDTSSGSVVTTNAAIHLVNSTTKIVISDIDGTITKSDVRGVVLPVLGLSDWKHPGVVQLYEKIADQGYSILYLTNRAIGQSDMTREYVFSLEDQGYSMPRGPLLLQIDSVLGAFQTEVITGQPEVNKMVALSKIKGLFPDNPFVAGFGNKAWDILAYKALNINPNMIYNVMEDSSLVVEGTGVPTSYDNLINNITTLFPSQNSL